MTSTSAIPQTEAEPAGRHRRRSSLSEALHAEPHQDSATSTPEETPATPEKGSQEHTGLSASRLKVGLEHPSKPTSPWEEPAGQSALPAHPISEAVDITGRQIEDSPFTSADSPSYVLCPEPPRHSTSSSNPLGTVPEDGPSPSDGILPRQSSSLDSEVVRPASLNLPTVRTPRKSTAIQEDALAGHDFQDTATKVQDLEQGRTQSSEDKFSIDFTRQQSEALESAFNPFAETAEELPPAQEAVVSPAEDSFFAMDFEAPSQHPSQELPFVAHLDFGERHGSGVVGPKINASGLGRSADKFEVKEGEDTEVKQLLWVIENLQEELHLSGSALERAETSIRDQQAIVDELQEENSTAEAEEAELDEELRVLHSKLEAQLLTKLEQEDEIRVSGDKLKTVKAEIVSLDESLARAEEQRRHLERQALEKRASIDTDIPKGGPAETEQPVKQHSPRSNYSSAWETSESEEEGSDIQGLKAPRPSISLFEDNQAKLKEKGGLGGSWLRSVLRGESRKDIEQSLDQAVGAEADQGGVIGAGQSHFQQPTTAAELAPAASDSLGEQENSTPT